MTETPYVLIDFLCDADGNCELRNHVTLGELLNWWEGEK